MDDAVRGEIESLKNQKTKQLRDRYRELFGEQSQSSNRTYLFRRIAWRLQALSEGDLSERARVRAAELGCRCRPTPSSAAYLLGRCRSGMGSTADTRPTIAADRNRSRARVSRPVDHRASDGERL